MSTVSKPGMTISKLEMELRTCDIFSDTVGDHIYGYIGTGRSTGE